MELLISATGFAQKYSVAYIPNIFFVQVGTWKSWFQGFYAIMIDAFRPGIPVFIRFYNSSVLDAHHLSIVRDVQGVFSVQQIIGEEKVMCSCILLWALSI